MCGQAADTLWHRTGYCIVEGAAINCFASAVPRGKNGGSGQALGPCAHHSWPVRRSSAPQTTKMLSSPELSRTRRTGRKRCGPLRAPSDAICTEEMSVEMKRAPWALFFYKYCGLFQLTSDNAVRRASSQDWRWPWRSHHAPRKCSLLAQQQWTLGIFLCKSSLLLAIMLSSLCDVNRPNVRGRQMSQVVARRGACRLGKRSLRYSAERRGGP